MRLVDPERESCDVIKCISSGKHVRKKHTPLKPQFYTVKLGFAGLYLVFLFLVQNIDCGYPLEPLRRNQCFEQKY